jgi:hypothetical protein
MTKMGQQCIPAARPQRIFVDFLNAVIPACPESFRENAYQHKNKDILQTSRNDKTEAFFECLFF